MAGPKKQTPAPIDRPLSRAYLREFTGWATAHAPGLADPTSLRIMRNVQIGRDGSARVRPAFINAFVEDLWFGGATDMANWPGPAPWIHGTLIGSFESFFDNDGNRCILFGLKLNPSTPSDMAVEFMVSRYDRVLKRFGPPFRASEMFSGVDPFTVYPGDLSFLRYIQIDNKIMVLSDTQSEPVIFYVGAEKRFEAPSELTRPSWTLADTPFIVMPTTAWATDPNKTTLPPPQTPTTTTLISSDASKNVYNVAYFYTTFNSFGESAPSQMKAFKVQRPWTAWNMGAETNPTQAVDQIVVLMPGAVYDAASFSGARGFNLYMTTWSDQDSVPVEAVLIATREFTALNPTNNNRYLQHTPATETYNYSAPLPTSQSVNYSTPPKVAQGLQVADRIVLVNDQENGARIRWSSNQPGEYMNFSSSKGGGYKTLSTGNMQLPVAVKLWQNPQSADTITILCQGVDGYSTSYYMAPAGVNGQTESLNIMGFEETTATPGTVSPYGVEVFNNALFHPLDDQLMKSTANNYNISHKSMTDDISNRWQQLVDKWMIQSCVYDNRIYYLVRSPASPLVDSLHSNEMWVYDAGAGAEGGSWSRYMVQAHAIRKMEVDGRDRLAIVSSFGIRFLDEHKHLDELPKITPPAEPLDDPTISTERVAIDWLLETNTQGANRAHDAWCNLQQVSVSFSNFSGTARYGIRSWDLHGKPVDLSKVYRQPDFPDWTNPELLPFDHEDVLLAQKDVKEWFFVAGAERDSEGQVLPSYGQISLVQYRYTPVSVNVGYEYGSVETFEYGHAGNDWVQRSSINGIPANVLDPRRP